MTAALPLLLLALGLAADCFAVALAQGAAMSAASGRALAQRALILALAFGAAQGLMPLIGWSLGAAFQNAIAPVDHWIAFALLALISGKMIREGLDRDPPPASPAVSLLAVLGLAIAVSIDAAAAGFTLTTLGAPVAISVAVIGGVSFLATLCGVYTGRAGAKAMGRRAELAGGVILIAIGVKVLIDHQAFG